MRRNHTIAMSGAGACRPRVHPGSWPFDPDHSADVLGRMISKSLGAMPMRLTVRQKSSDIRKLLPPDLREAHRKTRRRSRPRRLPRLANGKLSADKSPRALAKALINQPNCCCWTNRPRRSLPIPPLEQRNHDLEDPLAHHPAGVAQQLEVEQFVTASHHKRGRIEDNDSPATSWPVITGDAARVFLDVARGRVRSRS